MTTVNVSLTVDIFCYYLGHFDWHLSEVESGSDQHGGVGAGSHVGSTDVVHYV